MSIRENQHKNIFYADGITRVTDPFWKCTCVNCKRTYMSCISISNCPNCGCPDGVRFMGERPYDEVIAERGEPVLNYKYKDSSHFENQNKSE